MRIPITKDGNIRKEVDLEEDEEFSSVHGVFAFGHAEFEEKSQVPLPGRQWINSLILQREIGTLLRTLLLLLLSRFSRVRLCTTP